MIKWSFKRTALVLVGLLFLAWLSGLVCFVARVDAFAEVPADQVAASTDAIVVLTGGSERLSVGLGLLREGKGQKLFISGVHPGVTATRILAHADIPADKAECCIVLGHAADNTIGNASETKAFMQEQGYRSLRLVTAHYHMPRSMLLFQRAMPDLVIEPHPVAPDIVDVSKWLWKIGTASLLIAEYNKYLFASACIALEVW